MTGIAGDRAGGSIWMRPEHAAVGRPAQRSRGQITAAAVVIADREGLGPNCLILLEHVLDAVAPHPASNATKLEAFGVLNAVTALFVQNELSGGSARQKRNAAYLNHALASGQHPRLAQLLSRESPGAPDPDDAYSDNLARILTGMLTPSQPSAGPAATSRAAPSR
jgi:hypothetical protein